MGDRISIAFKNGTDTSVTLFSHWGGMGFLKTAQKYVASLKRESKKEGTMWPLYRLEPDTVMVDFIRFITHDMNAVKSDLYLGKDDTEGDNSDNGHHVIDLG